MAWPMAAEYAMMLQNSAVAFKDPELKKSTIKRDKNGLPFGMAGAFAIVYKATLQSGNHRAVRAFTSARDGRADTYRAISDYLAQHKHISSLVEFQYTEKGIRGGDGKMYPLVTMEWVQGTTLFDWVHRQCTAGNAKLLGGAVDRWNTLVDELTDANIAHGDLQHANVMVDDAHELKLVDYDCMCVPKLVGRPNLEIGVEPYQHPQRNAETLLTTNLDNFSALFIYVALRALAARPRLWIDYVEKHRYDKLLIRKEDFQSPTDSDLFKAFRTSPDQEVGRLANDLFELYRADMNNVPALRDVLFSFDKVGALISRQLYDEAVELVSRRKTRSAEPAELVQPIQNARQRVDCLKQLKAKIQAGDEAGMQALANSPLLQNYPAAQSFLQEAQLAAKALAWYAKLDAAKKAQSWRDLVKVWDAEGAALQKRPGAARYQSDVETWRKRNAAWDKVIVEYRKTPPDPAVLSRLWQDLQALGGHPEALPNKDKIEAAIARFQAWSKFPGAAGTPSQASDEQLVAAWREDLFAGWSVAEAERPRLLAAQKRLDGLLKLQRQIDALPGDPKLVGERQIVALAAALGGYSHGLAQRVQQAQSRVLAFDRFSGAIRDAITEASIVEAWTELQRAGGQALSDASQQQRVALAQQRLPLLQRLQKVPLTLPPDQLDMQLLAVWQKSLDACPEARPWKTACETAVRRRDLLQQIMVARERNDETALAELIKDPAIKGYPLPRDIAQAAAAAIDRLTRGHKLIEALQTGDRAAFREQFDQQLLRQSGTQFAPYHDLLRLWIVEEILPCQKIELKPPTGMSALVRQGEAYLVRWNFPKPRFTDSCTLAICRHPPKKGEDPRTIPVLEQTPITRRMYEDRGGRVLHPLPEWEGSYVVVWAVVEAGFATFVSEPLVLGRMSSVSKSAAKSDKPKRGWGIL